MSNEWQKLYTRLGNFIAGHPEVEIQQGAISIPENIRPAFYSLFDSVREAFLREKFSELLNEAEPLARAYLKVEAELTRLLELEGVFMSVNVQRFLGEPVNELMREIFDPLFSLLNGSYDMTEFSGVASMNVGSSFRRLYRQGYEKWVTLSLLKRFEPDGIFYVPIPKPSSGEIIKHPVGATESVPFPEESKRLCFEVGGRDILLVPDAIIHSVEINRYVGFRTEMGRAIWLTASLNERRQWYSIESIVDKYGIVSLRPNLLIYIDDRPEDISLVADSENICRPDVIIECVDGADGDESLWREKLEKVNSYDEILKPVFGTFMVSKQCVPERMREVLGESIHLLEVDFDESKLNPIIDVVRP